MNLSARVISVPTIAKMADAISVKDDGSSEVLGLTLWLKISLLLFVQGPRVVMNSFLLWLGARWLTATLGFGDLLLNALALEFILNLSHLLYEAMVPYNGKLLTQRTMIPHVRKHERENCCNMFGMFSCGGLAVALCFTYMYFLQTVLPSYKWDVHIPCEAFLKKELSV